MFTVIVIHQSVQYREVEQIIVVIILLVRFNRLPQRFTIGLVVQSNFPPSGKEKVYQTTRMANTMSCKYFLTIK